MKRLLLSTLLAIGLSANAVYAEDYTIDTKGMHATVMFRVKHLGFSWLYGRFDDFSGTFSFDEAKPDASKASVTVKTESLNSNNAERDKHLRSSDFLEAAKFPEASFTSTAYKVNSDGTSALEGNFTLKGVTKPMIITVTPVGAGKDPWGGVRRGFEGKASFKAADFGIASPMVDQVELILAVEGVQGK